jgi:hypothetical protein
MTRKVWELIFLLLDTVGVIIFVELFVIILPSWRNWKKERLMFASAIMKLALALFFAWLFLVDIAALLNIKEIQWLAEFPTRGIGLRLIVLIPGLGLFFRVVR